MESVKMWMLVNTLLEYNSDKRFSPAQGIRVLVDAREKLQIPWGKPSNQRHGDTMMAFDTRSAMAHGHGMVEHKVFQHYLPSIRALWADEGIQNAYDRRREFQLVSESTLRCCVKFRGLCGIVHMCVKWMKFCCCVLI